VNKLDERILRTYFRVDEFQTQRLRFERLLHPEKFKWSKDMPPMSTTTKIKVEELAEIGFGEGYYRRMSQGEEVAKTELGELAELHPLWEFIEPIRGFGKYLAGAFIAAGGDISRAPKASSFWKGMGLDIITLCPDCKKPNPLGAEQCSYCNALLNGDGQAPRRIRGKKDIERKIPALPHVTKIGELIRQQMLKQNPFYQELYYKHKEDYLARYPDKPRMFAHKHGLRIAQKILYACLWEKWRQAFGLPTPLPYVFDILKHDSGRVITIQDFHAKPE